MNIREALTLARAVAAGEETFLGPAAVEQLLEERAVMHELYADLLRLLVEERRISDRIDDMAARMEAVDTPSPPEGPAARVSDEVPDLPMPGVRKVSARVRMWRSRADGCPQPQRSIYRTCADELEQIARESWSAPRGENGARQGVDEFRRRVIGDAVGAARSGDVKRVWAGPLARSAVLHARVHLLDHDIVAASNEEHEHPDYPDAGEGDL